MTEPASMSFSWISTPYKNIIFLKNISKTAADQVSFALDRT